MTDLQIAGVAGIDLHGNAGNDFAVASEQLQLAVGEQRIVVVGHVADAVALMLLVSVLQFALLDVIGRARKGRDRLALLVVRVPAAVVEVQVSVDDDVDLVGRNLGLLEALHQQRLIAVDGLASFR